jgi:predicted porin
MGGKSASDVNGAAAATAVMAMGKDKIGDKAGDTCLKTWTLAAAYQFGPARVYGSYSRVKLPLAKVPSEIADNPKHNYSFAALAHPKDRRDTPLYSMPSDGDFVIGGYNNESSSTLDFGVHYQVSPALSLISSLQYTRAKFARRRPSAAGQPGRQVRVVQAHFHLRRRAQPAFVRHVQRWPGQRPCAG